MISIKHNWLSKSEPVFSKLDSLNFGPVNNWCATFVFQEGDWAFSASSEARVLCETGHEGHPHRPAHDLYTSHCLYGQLHEKVSCLPSTFKYPVFCFFLPINPPFTHSSPPLRHQLSVNYTGVSCVTYNFFLSVLSPQHPALRGHCVHVPVPRRRQVHVPLPSSKKGGHEQQWGEERDLGRGWALFVTRTEAHKPASMRKQPLRIKMGKMEGRKDWI